MTMKKLLLMVFVLAIGIYAIGQQPTTIKDIKTVPQIEEHGATNVVPYVKPGNTDAIGDDCTDPIIINIPGDLPFTDANQTTCGRLNNYDATCLGSYDGGEDIMYELNVTTAGNYDFSVASNDGSNWMGMLIDDECPDGDVTCIATANSSSGTSMSISNVALTVGIYYLMIDTWPTPTCIGDFNLNIIVTPPIPPNDDCGSAQAVAGPYPQNVSGTTLGATTDCVGWLDWDAVWYTIDLPNVCNSVKIDMCGATAPLTNTGIILTTDCSCTTGSAIYSNGEWNVTGNCINNLVFENIVGPTTVYYPVMTEPKQDFSFDVMVFDCANTIITWYNLQWPPTATITELENATVYAQCWEDGFTNQPGPTPGLDCWIGYSTTDTDPSGWTDWVPATFNDFYVGNNDEFLADLGLAQSLTPGTYYYASRFQHNGGGYYYGGTGGPWSNDNGVLTVEAASYCQYEICLEDTYGDGWNGGLLDVYVNGILLYDDLTIIAGGGPECYVIPVNSGDVISTDYTAGSWPTENEYYINDSYGTQVAYEGSTGSVPGDIAGLTAECPCCAHYVELTDTYGDGWNGGLLDILVNGVVVLDNLTINDPGSFEFFYFDACTGDDIDADYTAGSWSYENEYQVFDALGNLLGESGQGGATPVDVLDMVGNCIPPSCPDPSDLNTSLIIATEADLGWTENGTATAWEIEYGDAGFVLGTGTLLPATTIPHTLWGLTPGTSYDWYVRADCGGGLYSNWVGPDNFSTLLANDDCTDAIAVICGSITSGTTIGAAIDTEVNCPVAITAPGVWYSFAGTGEMVSADVCTASYDTKLYVYTGTCVSLICYDGNDDYCGTRSRVDWFAESGITYYLLIHGYGSGTGTFDLTIDCTSPATATWVGGDASYQDPNPYEDWFGADNWDVADVPGATTDVTLPPGLTYYPTIDRAAVCDDIFLGSDGSGTATILGNGFLTLSKGTATVQRYYPTGGTTNSTEWHLISAPISNAQSGIYTSYYLRWYEEGIDQYHDIIPTTDPLTSLQGFAFFAPNDGMTFNYVGTMGNGQYTLPVSAHGPDIYHWNLFGNPYPSSLDWDVVAADPGNNAIMQTGAIYYMDQATGNWLSYIGGTGAGSRYVPLGQGFFISIGAEPNIFMVDNSMRTHTIGTPQYYKSEFENLLVLEAEGNDYTDATYLRFDDGASEEIDQLDAYKLFTVSNPYLPQLYTVGGDKLSINVLPETEMVPAGFKAGVPGVYTINIKEVTGMANVVLEDLVLETQTDLMENDYTFNYNLDDPEGRFIIHFTPLSVPENLAELVNIYSYNKDVYVTVPENTKGNIVIFNMMGQEVASTTITDVLNIIPLEKGAYYVVKVLSSESVVTKKVFVK